VVIFQVSDQCLVGYMKNKGYIVCEDSVRLCDNRGCCFLEIHSRHIYTVRMCDNSECSVNMVFSLAFYLIFYTLVCFCTSKFQSFSRGDLSHCIPQIPTNLQTAPWYKVYW
jgi:hypothetical protein